MVLSRPGTDYVMYCTTAVVFYYNQQNHMITRTLNCLHIHTVYVVIVNYQHKSTVHKPLYNQLRLCKKSGFKKHIPPPTRNTYRGIDTQK